MLLGCGGGGVLAGDRWEAGNFFVESQDLLILLLNEEMDEFYSQNT